MGITRYSDVCTTVEVTKKTFSDDSDAPTTENAGNSARLVLHDSGEGACAASSLAMEGEDKLPKHFFTPYLVDAVSAIKLDSVDVADPNCDVVSVVSNKAVYYVYATEALLKIGEGTEVRREETAECVCYVWEGMT